MTGPTSPDPAVPVPPGAKVSFLGPRGTFTEQALLTQPDLAAADLVPYPTMSEVLRAVESGEVDLGFVAIENSIEGTVNVTSDVLTFDVDLLIQREVVLNVQQHLLVVPGTTIDQITEIASYPHATAQVRGFLDRTLPGIRTRAANSTAEAAKRVAESGDRSLAAIGSDLAASTYGLEILVADIEDHPENKTRFVVVASEGVPPPTHHDKTTVVAFQRTDRPGSLLMILQEFAGRRINLTRLESRPTKQALGDYCFVLDLEGHVADPMVGDCLKQIKAKHGDVKFLGSYPSATESTDADVREADVRAEADQWMRSIRESIRTVDGKTPGTDRFDRLRSRHPRS